MKPWVQLSISLGTLTFIVLVIVFHAKDYHTSQIPLNEITITHEKKLLSGTLDYDLQTCLDNHKFGRLKIFIDCRDKVKRRYRTDI